MIVFDASTLILLAKIDLLDEVISKYTTVISMKVQEESTRKKELPDAKLIQARIESGVIKVDELSAKDLAAKIKHDFNLGDGESESIVLVKEGKGRILATDDGPTIRACKVLGIGTVSAPVFLVQAYQKGEITKEIAMAKLSKLERYGRYLPSIIQDVKSRIGGE